MAASKRFSTMEKPANYLLQWTEKARIQLIEAVIDVEEQMIVRASTGPRCPTGKRMINSRFEYKWSTVASLLPIEYRAKIWNEKKQMYYKLKCDRMFNSLLHAYREKVAGKFTQAARWEMSEKVFNLLKKREDLVRERCSETAQRSLRPESSTNAGVHDDQRNNLLSVIVAEEAEENTTELGPNFRSCIEQEAGSCVNQPRLSDTDDDAASAHGRTSQFVCLSDSPHSRSSSHEEFKNLEDVDSPSVRNGVQTRTQPLAAKGVLKSVKRPRSPTSPAINSQPASFIHKRTAAKAEKKKKQVLLVDIYAKGGERYRVHEQKTVEPKRCCQQSASEGPNSQVTFAGSAPGSSRPVSDRSTDPGNKVRQDRLKVHARAPASERRNYLNSSRR